jgi:hypothetical protein
MVDGYDERKTKYGVELVKRDERVERAAREKTQSFLMHYWVAGVSYALLMMSIPVAVFSTVQAEGNVLVAFVWCVYLAALGYVQRMAMVRVLGRMHGLLNDAVEIAKRAVDGEEKK